MKNQKDPEFEMFPFFEMTPDLVCVASKEGYFKKVNHAVIQKLGYTEKELLGIHIQELIHADDKDITARERERLLHGEPLINFQNRYIAKNGRIVWLDWTSIYFPDQEVVFAIAKDVTERKYAEKEIEEKYRKFKNLATHFKRSIEKDRKYFAIELHEELAQLASVVKMDIDWVRHHSPDLPADSKNRIEHAVSVAETLIHTIRKISFSVSPNMLDDFGLNETLKWLCKEFSILYGINCVFESIYNETNLSHEVKLDFFRICQESLNNVMNHAAANIVIVRIEDIGNKISLCIIDDGKGFDTGQPGKASGITNMRELAASFNGQLTISSEPGKGTKICVTIPKQYVHAD